MRFDDLSCNDRIKCKHSFIIYANICKAAVVVCFILICVLSLIPSQDVPSVYNFPFKDKGAHSIAYAGFAVFAFLSISFSLIVKHVNNQSINGIKEDLIAALHVFIVGIPLGLLIEYIQSKVGRSFDLYDWLADTIGLVIGCFIALMINKYTRDYEIKKILSNK